MLPGLWADEVGEAKHPQGSAQGTEDDELCAPALALPPGDDQRRCPGGTEERHLGQVDEHRGGTVPEGLVDGQGKHGRSAIVDLTRHPDHCYPVIAAHEPDQQLVVVARSGPDCQLVENMG